jgi:type I restriction enzyme S subunit
MGRPMATSQDFVNWVCGPNLDPHYLKYVLLAENEALWRFASGTTHQTIYYPEAKAFHICLPPLAEQKRITGILCALDNKIELNRKMNETLEQIAKALFKSWFVDFDPVHAKAAGRQPAGIDKATADLSPDCFVDSELGKIPKGWRSGKINEAFSLTMGQSPSGECLNQESKGVPFYQGSTDFGFRFPTRRIFTTSPARYAKKGDTLVSVRAPVGDINMAQEDCCIGRGVAAIRHKTGARSFTYYATSNMRNHFSKFEAEGTVFGSINREGFENLPFVIAPDEVIAAFERMAEPIDEKILLLTEQSKNLTSLRDSLLPKMLSGEINTVA